MSRRGFLRLAGVTATTVVMPTLWLPGMPLPADPFHEWEKLLRSGFIDYDDGTEFVLADIMRHEWRLAT